MESRTAISGLIPVRPFNRLESVLRLTPRAWAASVTLKPRGSRHNVRKISPGWGGLCINMTAPLMRVLIVDGLCVLTTKNKGYAPVPADFHGPRPLAVSLEFVEV